MYREVFEQKLTGGRSPFEYWKFWDTTKMASEREGCYNDLNALGISLSRANNNGGHCSLRGHCLGYE